VAGADGGEPRTVVRAHHPRAITVDRTK
jgi:hypothetical protein